MTTAPDPVVRLAPPGAGLPALELAVARLLFAWRRHRTSRAAAAALIANERTAILALVGALDPADAARPVLIRRLRGLEDSSRQWSVFMTLEHLRIVNLAAAGVIASLGRGRVPDRVASTAAVKPAPGIGADVVPAFAASCDAVARAVDGIADLRTPARFAHPWFGPLDAAGWQVLVGGHLNLHRQQILAIQAGL